MAIGFPPGKVWAQKLKIQRGKMENKKAPECDMGGRSKALSPGTHPAARSPQPATADSSQHQQ